MQSRYRACSCWSRDWKDENHGHDGPGTPLPLLLPMSAYFFQVRSSHACGPAVQTARLVLGLGLGNREQAAWDPFWMTEQGQPSSGANSHMASPGRFSFLFFLFLGVLFNQNFQTDTEVCKQTQWSPVKPCHLFCLCCFISAGSILPLVEIWIVSNFQLLRVKLLGPCL